MTVIRPAVPADIPAIMAVWNPLIRDTTVTFSSEEKTAEGLAAMIAERRAAGREFLVAEDGEILGLCSYAQFRAGNGYARTMEHTIILAPQAWGRGIGRALVTAIEAHAAAGGAHVMVAGVTGENAAGLAFHRALGYAEVGRMPATGFKFGRWLDLVLMQKYLSPP